MQTFNCVGASTANPTLFKGRLWFRMQLPPSVNPSFLPNSPLMSAVWLNGKGWELLLLNLPPRLTIQFQDQVLGTVGGSGLAVGWPGKNGIEPLFFLYLMWANSAILTCLWRRKRRYFLKMCIDCPHYAWVWGKHIMLSFILVTRRVVNSSFVAFYGLLLLKLEP